jgi:RNA polymerase sigma-70 factor (ECF subfamily)
MGSPSWSGPKAGGATVTHVPLERYSDAQLVRDVVAGNSPALGVIWDRYAKLVRSVLFGAIGPDSAIEDLLQDVFLAFQRAAPNMLDGGALRGYLISIAVRTAGLELRRRKLRRWVGLSATGELPEVPAPPEDAEARESLRALYRVLDQLSPRRRLAFVLRHVQGLPMRDVSLALKISESTTQRELLRAHEQIAALAKREPSLTHYLALRTRSREGEP